MQSSLTSQPSSQCSSRPSRTLRAVPPVLAVGLAIYGITSHHVIPVILLIGTGLLFHERLQAIDRHAATATGSTLAYDRADGGSFSALRSRRQAAPRPVVVDGGSAERCTSAPSLRTS